MAEYLFLAFSDLGTYLDNDSSQFCPPWLKHVLRQKVFVVKQSNGDHRLGDLKATVFVPDSPLLNPIFESKVDFLYFGEHDMGPLLQLLRHSDSGLRYLSSYDRPEDMNIKVVPPISDDREIRNILQTAQRALLR